MIQRVNEACSVHQKRRPWFVHTADAGLRPRMADNQQEECTRWHLATKNASNEYNNSTNILHQSSQHATTIPHSNIQTRITFTRKQTEQTTITANINCKRLVVYDHLSDLMTIALAYWWNPYITSWATNNTEQRKYECHCHRMNSVSYRKPKCQPTSRMDPSGEPLETSSPEYRQNLHLNSPQAHNHR